MGYCYTQDGRLCCDSCGNAGNVRKRTCPHIVDGLPYCSPPALCPDCYKKHGGAKIHDRCKEPAAKSRAEHEHRRQQLEAGRYEVRAAWGSWHDSVPAGYCGVLFRNKDDQELYRLIPEADYNPPGALTRPLYLDEYPVAIEWKRPAA